MGQGVGEVHYPDFGIDPQDHPFHDPHIGIR